jgi:cellulose synthase/poly-beta-1,6-N-acetylglucosamine synthase-like glycosyltransferase
VLRIPNSMMQITSLTISVTLKVTKMEMAIDIQKYTHRHDTISLAFLINNACNIFLLYLIMLHQL